MTGFDGTATTVAFFNEGKSVKEAATTTSSSFALDRVDGPKPLLVIMGFARELNAPDENAPAFSVVDETL
jgi:hypothetical protein